jgi:BirA family biotin operon repressor/biotin-[acetyl-CoA-carboxylase] ligase
MPKVTSTNSFAQQLLKDEPPEGTLVTADAQSEGRGQAGTRWHAAEGQNLLMSLILYPRIAAREAYALGQMAALALWRCIHEYDTDANLHIKWPNDILLEEKKLAGILIENQLQGEYVNTCIVGIGININQSIFPPDSGNPTSLFLHSGKYIDRKALLDKLLNYLEASYLRLRQHGASSFKRDFEARMYGYQQQRLLRFGGEEHLCMIKGTDAQGRLLVELPEGGVRSFGLKEVEWLGS